MVLVDEAEMEERGAMPDNASVAGISILRVLPTNNIDEAVSTEIEAGISSLSKL